MVVSGTASRYALLREKTIGRLLIFEQPSTLGSSKPAWLTYDDAWVDEVARGWAACGVLLWLP